MIDTVAEVGDEFEVGTGRAQKVCVDPVGHRGYQDVAILDGLTQIVGR